MRTPLEMVIKYKEMESIIPNSGMLREVMWQYADMANGGEGGYTSIGDNQNTTCRELNYPDHPDSFFQEVCSLMNWPW